VGYFLEKIGKFMKKRAEPPNLQHLKFWGFAKKDPRKKFALLGFFCGYP